MSSGAVTAYQAMGANTSLGVGNQSYYQPATSQQSNNGYQPQQGGLRTDSIMVSNEAAIPHSMSLQDAAHSSQLQDAARNSYRAEKIGSSENQGKLGVAWVGVAIALLMFAVLPAWREAASARPKVRRFLIGEAFEHKIHDAHRSAGDPSMDWVNNKEFNSVAGELHQAIVADLRDTFNTLLTHKTGTPEYKAAEDRAHKYQLPIIHTKKGWVASGVVKSGNVKGRVVFDSAKYLVGTHLHKRLEAQKDLGFADGDHLRITQQQNNLFLDSMTHNQRNINLNYDTLAKARSRVYDKKLTEWYHAAIDEFLARDFKALPSAFVSKRYPHNKAVRTAVVR